MLPPRNLLIVSLVILLATTVSTAPVEEKEREEAELEATEEVEGELSEEEEDDDDSQSQHKIKAGNLGTQQTITSIAAAGGSVSGGPSAGMGPNDGAAGSSAGLHGAVFSVDSAAAGGPSSSSGQTHLGSDKVDSNINGNGQKILNGGGGGGEGVGVHSQTGVLGTFGGGVSHLSQTGGSPTGEMNAGIIDPSSHDHLLGLWYFLLSGGGLINHFNLGSHVSIAGHKTPPTHLDSTVIGSGVTGAPFGDKSILDSPADVAHHSAISAGSSGPDSPSSGPGLSADRPGPDGSSPGSGPDQTLSNDRSGPDGFSVVSGLDPSLLRPASGPSLSAAGSSSSLDNGAFREQTEEAESADNNGNGRQSLLTDTNGAVTDRTASSSDLGSLQTDLTGGAAESVTRLHPAGPASTMEPARDVTESSFGGLHTASGVGVTHTLGGVSGIYSHTDFITVTADFIGRSTADPTGTPFDSSHPAVTDHTQMAGSVTEQYNPSGQGPEGAENVELEDTC
ncbi:hypothetical protein OJAV_G00113960 [Oryzias javanicus]|uniref:Uncharacterized protein n=1 Tax=Oryzias javanicus TaxID=123683 RepID=A0A3S2P8E2_ORYJA|nr:hypothetical protein OJAV_G00113960 [Oryzias javanicus]